MLTAEQWSVVSTLIAIFMFVLLGPSFAYKGFKDSKQADSTEVHRIWWGRFEFCLGIILSVLAVCFVFFLIQHVKNYIIADSSESLPSASTEPIESLKSETNAFYVSNQLYQGAVYSGYVNELYQPDGEGIMKYSNGSEYTGTWVDGVRQGQGTMKYENGIYKGEWQNGKKHGKGTYTWNNGKEYEGAYEDDVRSGKGIFYGWVDLTNGYSGTYYGESRNDQFDGYGYFCFDNGDKFDGIYKENLYWTGVYTRADGSKYEIVDGKPQ